MAPLLQYGLTNGPQPSSDSPNENISRIAIDQVNRSWNTDLIDRLFSQEDAATIKAIPLSWKARDDS
ncbi:hypothetical protein DITRI_Ditri07aG0034700 [Diplodiscus trichospermus]